MTTTPDLAAATEAMERVIAWYDKEITAELHAHPDTLSPRQVDLLAEHGRHTETLRLLPLDTPSDELPRLHAHYTGLYRQLTALDFLTPDAAQPHIADFAATAQLPPPEVIRSVAHWCRDRHPAFAILAATGTIPDLDALMDAIGDEFNRGVHARLTLDALSAVTSYALRTR